MGAGGSLQLLYHLSGPLPEGGYAVKGNGITTASDAKVHVDLVYHPMSGQDQIVGSIDSTPQTPGFHLQPYIDGTICGKALPAQAGDVLLLKFSYTGSSAMTVLETSMTIP